MSTNTQCKWCGAPGVGPKCNRCISRYSCYMNTKRSYLSNPTSKNLRKLERKQQEYVEIHKQGYKVPEDLNILLKGT